MKQLKRIILDPDIMGGKPCIKGSRVTVGMISEKFHKESHKKLAIMKLSFEQIREIADNLDAGLKCFYNLKTGEIKTLLNFDNWAGADMEPWEEEVMEIEENWNDYFEFKGFESHESFEIMADFADNIDNESLRQELFIALNRSKPFQNFKRIIDNSGKYRQRWFDYKEMRYIQWVEKQIDWENTRDTIQKDDS